MYVCVCRAVTENQVIQAARSGARSLKDLRQQLGIISECGRCAACARSCLASAQAGSAGPGEATGRALA